MSGWYWIAHVCERFGWTYQEFEEQPLELIKTIASMNQIDAARANSEARK